MSEEARRSIEPLEESTVQRIAAGEVVERPASVVKELVENSLDADASRVIVAVDRGGTERIRVTDDGIGIPEDELVTAVEEHTTSKIRDLDDLEAGVGTLGFRGEALSTIGAVSRMTVKSKPTGETVGAELTVEGGEIGDPTPVGCPEGTIVEVRDLFYNTPARKKFLKQDATEFDRVNTVVTQYALANPDVAIALEHDGREVFSTEGNGDLRSTVLSVYGREVAESMIEIDTEALEEPGPIGSIDGLVSHPETNRSSRDYLATFVNDRYVTTTTLRNAVIEAYGNQLAPDRYPFAVLFVELPPDSVDVNVHPRKLEVRFDDEAAVERQVRTAIRESLVSAGLVRSRAPRGRSAPEETAIDPSERAEADRSIEAESPTEIDRSADAENLPEAERSTDSGDGEEAVGSNVDPVDPASDEAWSVDGLGGSRSPSIDRGETDRPAPDVDSIGPEIERSETDETGDRSIDETGDRSTDETGDRSTDGAAASADRFDDGRIAEPPAQRSLDGTPASEEASYDRLPSLRVLGQLSDTYVIAEADDGLVLIDQHAADERIHYERLQDAFEGSPTSQALASPVEIELTAREAELFESSAATLRNAGFAAERIDDRWVRVSQVPAVFDAALDPELLREVLVSTAEAAEADEPLSEVADDLLSDLACHPAVTGNTSLTEGSIVDLLEALDDCVNPYECPHGRPTIVRIDRDEIDDRFERDYPGHADGRRSE